MFIIFNDKKRFCLKKLTNERKETIIGCIP
jgi:hypothetical protein